MWAPIDTVKLECHSRYGAAHIVMAHLPGGLALQTLCPQLGVPAATLPWLPPPLSRLLHDTVFETDKGEDSFPVPLFLTPS